MTSTVFVRVMVYNNYKDNAGKESILVANIIVDDLYENVDVLVMVVDKN